MKNDILIINTGGTIGMVHSDPNNSLSPLTPAKSWHEIASKHSNLVDVGADYYQLKKLQDSSNMDPDTWYELIKVIESKYADYMGFVILHGTDTMAYTASFLSYTLKNLNKPIILTGSQLPLQNKRSDALQNLITTLEIASYHKSGLPKVPEVAIFFHDDLIRGNRARKLDSKNYFGFASPNYPVLGKAGADINIREKFIEKRVEGAGFFVDYALDSNILMLDIFPGFNMEFLELLFHSNNNIKGIILKTYGSGNAPTTDKFLRVIESLILKGVIIVNITQCVKGSVKMGLYETSAKLEDLGVISGLDMTPEAATTKLMYLLGKTLTKSELIKAMELDIAGEQTLDHYRLSYSLEKSFKNASFAIDETKEITNKVVEGVIRIESLSVICETPLTITLEGDREVLKLKSIILTPNTTDYYLNISRELRKILQSKLKFKITLQSQSNISISKLKLSLYLEN